MKRCWSSLKQGMGNRNEKTASCSRTGYAEFEAFNITAAYGGAITDRTGFQTAVDHTTADEGWIENLAEGQDDRMFGDGKTFCTRLVSDLTDTATLDLIYARAG